MATIAASLSEAQRRCLLAMTERWQRPGRATFNAGAAHALRYSRYPIVTDAIIGRTLATAHKEYRLLPLGAAVCDHLLTASGDAHPVSPLSVSGRRDEEGRNPETIDRGDSNDR